MIFEVGAEPAGCGTQRVQGIAFILGSEQLQQIFLASMIHPSLIQYLHLFWTSQVFLAPKLEIFYIFLMIHNPFLPVKLQMSIVKSFQWNFKNWCCLKTFEDLGTEHPWWATATGRPRPRSARGCLPGPSAEHRHPPKRSRRGALHTNLPAFKVMVVVVMVLDNMRCDIFLTVHLTCMHT